MADPASTPENNPAAGQTGNSGSCRRGPRHRRWVLAGVAVATGLVGFGIGKATSAHWGRHFGAGFGMHRPVDADTLIRQTDAGIARVLSRVDATAEQKAKIGEITKAAVKDLMPLRDTHNAVRDKLVAALKAEKIDRALIEQLRSEEIALAETLSKRASQALADIAEVLTSAQRTKLVDHWQSRFRRG